MLNQILDYAGVNVTQRITYVTYIASHTNTFLQYHNLTKRIHLQIITFIGLFYLKGSKYQIGSIQKKIISFTRAVNSNYQLGRHKLLQVFHFFSSLCTTILNIFRKEKKSNQVKKNVQHLNNSV